MNRFLIWGTGGVAVKNYELYKKIDVLKDLKIVGFVDNNSQKWGKELDGLPIFAPDEIADLDWDYICIFSSYKEQILIQLQEMGVSEDRVRSIFKPYVEQLKEKYILSDDPELKDVLQRMEDTDYLKVYYFTCLYEEPLYEAFYDEEADLYYTFFENKRLYLKRGYPFIIKGDKRFLKQIWYEQDLNSPHLYQKDGFCVDNGDILVDCGVCEGNFALHNIDKVSKVYLVECDEDWIEALQYTFAPYKEKVIYCNKYLSNTHTEDTITLDDMIKEKVDFIKMDIEGEEINALKGGERLFKESNLKCSICSYHCHGDEEKIREILQSYGYMADTSKGYMLFLYDDYVLKNPELRKGIVYGKKL